MTSPVENNNFKDEVIIHVFVVGFHHKKGCMVEFSYPPLSDEDNLIIPGDLPEPWKHLPTLALPDGAHNYEKDTIYFHLPSLDDPSQTVYGISCYRQISAQQLLRRSSDITRETVQKSVCVVSRLPLFGLIQAKLELITHAYFDERDFSKVSLLEETYRNLNSSLPKELLDGQQAFLGLSVRDFVLRFKHKTLLLFKLLLLERKVLFYKAPVKDLCSAVLTLCSLIPGMIETGLGEAATSVFSRQSPDLLDNLCDTGSDNNNIFGDLSQNATPDQPNFQCNLNNNLVSPVKAISKDLDIIPNEESSEATRDQCLATNDKCNELESKASQSSSDTENDSWTKANEPIAELSSNLDTSADTELKVKNVMPNHDRRSVHEIGTNQSVCNHSSLPSTEFSNDLRCLSETDVNRFVGYLSMNDDHSSNSLPMTVEGKSISFDQSNETSTEKCYEFMDGMTNNIPYEIPNVIDIESSECGLPLAIFTKGMFCHPYLSLPFLDLLSDVSVRGFLVGATNILFKQKKHLFDVIVEVDEGKVEILDAELRRHLSLTTEDLRFADHLLRHVMEDKKDVFLDGTGWEGGDEWLRSQFKLYLLSLMRTSLIDGSPLKEGDAFNPVFINTWKLTHNYRMWCKEDHSAVMKLAPGHPFQGQLSMADMKLKFSHSMQSTEKGRRINSAVANTGKAMLQTGKAVGGAFSSAKSAVSSWWSTFNAQEKREDKSNEPFEGETPEQHDPALKMENLPKITEISSQVTSP